MTTDPSTPVVREQGPPAQWLFHRVVNPVMTWLLRSPLHFVVSDSLMLLTFTGSRSGREYTTPVGYHEFGDDLVVFTHSDWWKNLRGGAVVMLRLKGERIVGHATPVEEPEPVAEYIIELIEARGTGAARRLGLEFEGEEPPTKAELIEGIDKTVAIEIGLTSHHDG